MSGAGVSASVVYRSMIATAVLALLAACGGGGGDAGVRPSEGSQGAGNNADTGATGTGTGSVAAPGVGMQTFAIAPSLPLFISATAPSKT